MAHYKCSLCERHVDSGYFDKSGFLCIDCFFKEIENIIRLIDLGETCDPDKRITHRNMMEYLLDGFRQWHEEYYEVDIKIDEFIATNMEEMMCSNCIQQNEPACTPGQIMDCTLLFMSLIASKQ